MKNKRFVLSVIVGCGILVGTGWAQQFPATVNIPVTFYDFHSDKSNPEFEQPHNGGVHLGMVANVIDGERKPVLGPAPYRNYYIKKWFRPWQPGDFTITSYTVLSGGELNAALQFNGIVTVNYDTAFKNVVIPMNLPFTYIPGSTGMYQYNNQNFFLLDGLGFGNESLAHNFSFTMELHNNFTYNQGLRFDFEGDDDVWVFINNSLSLDLGGIHPTTAGSINLDTLTGMQIGKKYSFDLFYAERHTTSSDIRITTNLFTPPGYLQLFSKPDAPGPANPMLGPLDTATAGQNFTLYAHVFDSLYNWVPANDNLVTWSMTDTMGNPILSTIQGSSTGFIPTEANGRVVITATFIDPANPSKVLTASISVCVLAGSAEHVVIETDTNGRMRSPRNDDPIGGIGTVTIGPADLVRNVYATLRDKYGNYVGQSQHTQWDTIRILTPGVASVHSGNIKMGEGVIIKLGVADSILVRAKDLDLPDNPIDTIKVIVTTDRTSSRLEFLSISKARDKAKIAYEYYNLRGQKLSHYGIRHADGIVLERVIESTGKVSVRKKLVPKP